MNAIPKRRRGRPETPAAADYGPRVRLDNGTAILTYEGSTMRAAQQRAAETTAAPLERLQLAFRLVGRNLAHDSIARAGIRIAAEAADCFPERKINPFRTWEKFVLRNLEEAQNLGHLRPDADINSVAWLFVAAGMGTKDLLGFTGECRFEVLLGLCPGVGILLCLCHTIDLL